MPYLVLDPATAQAAPVVSFGAPELAAKHPMGKSLGDITERLIKELGNRTDLRDTGLLEEWVNDAYQDFYGSLRLPESSGSYGMTLVAGQPLYLIPPTVGNIRDISGTDVTYSDTGGALRKIDVFSYRKLPIQTGQPEVWFREKDMLVFWPTPDAAYPVSVDIVVKPGKLTQDTHYPALDDSWHEALYKAAKYRAWEGIQNDTKAALTQNEMTRLVQRKNDRDAEDRQTEYPAFRPIRSKAELMALRSKPTRIEPGE